MSLTNVTGTGSGVREHTVWRVARILFDYVWLFGGRKAPKGSLQPLVDIVTNKRRETWCVESVGGVAVTCLIGRHKPLLLQWPIIAFDINTHELNIATIRFVRHYFIPMDTLTE